MAARVIVMADDDENVTVSCDVCIEPPIVIHKELAASPFYDMHVGVAILRMLGHTEYEHNGRIPPSEKEGK